MQNPVGQRNFPAHSVGQSKFQHHNLSGKGNVLVDARPRVAQFTKDGNFVWVSSEIGGTISIIDAKTYLYKSIAHS